MNAPGLADWRGTDLVSFGCILGPYAGVVKRVAGAGGGSRSSRTFFFIFVTLRNQRNPPGLLLSRRNSANPNPTFRGIVVLREVNCLAHRLFPPFEVWEYRGSRAWEGPNAPAQKEGAPDLALLRAAEWTHAAASGIVARACGGGGAACGGGGGHECEDQGQAGGG